jgi:hypothetical protein
MLASIVATDCDELSVQARVNRPYQAWVSVTVRTTTDASRAATLIVSPAVARSLIDELRNAVAALDAEMAASAAQVADAG